MRTRNLWIALVYVSLSCIAALAAEKIKEPTGFVRAKLKKDAPNYVIEYFKKTEAGRLEAYPQAEALYKKYKDGKSTEQKKIADNAKKEMKRLTEDVLSWTPEMPLGVQIGTIGTLGVTTIEQVISPQRALMRKYANDDTKGFLFMLQGVSTEGWTDANRMSITLNMTLVVTGTERYATVLGSSKTVLLFEPFNAATYIDAADMAASKAKDDAKKALEENAKVAARAAEAGAKTKPELDEKAAEAKLKAAKALLADEKRDGYRKMLKEIVDKYPETKAAKDAKRLLRQ